MNKRKLTFLLVVIFFLSFLKGYSQKRKEKISIYTNNTKIKRASCSSRFVIHNQQVKEFMKDIFFPFLGGVIMGHFSHEVSHILLLKINNLNYDYHFPDYISYERPMTSIQMAGFAEQLISTEFIISLNQRSYFLYGWLFYNVANSIVYPLHSYMRDGGYKDLSLDYISPRTRNIASTILITHAVFTIWRLYNDKDFNNKFSFFFNPKDKSVGVQLTLRF